MRCEKCLVELVNGACRLGHAQPRSSEPRADVPASAPPRPSPSARASGERLQPIDVKDPYAVLGIARTATDDEIREAYKAKATRWHPDRVNGNELKFREATFARDVLLDPNRRALFDAHGPASFAPDFKPPTKFQVPTDSIEVTEMVGHGIGQLGDYLKTDEGQRMAIKGMRAVTKLQTPGGQAQAKAALTGSFLDMLEKLQ